MHGVNYHVNGVDQEAHKGAVMGLAADANCIYTYGPFSDSNRVDIEW